jgi:GT2 family glycosyltransferase
MSAPAVDVQPGELAFVINSFNRLALLPRAVGSLYAHLRPLPSDVVVVDDGSTDGSAEWVAKAIASGKYPGLRLLQPAQKVAFAGGVNLGFLNTSAPYVCLFETDNVALDNGIWRAVPYLRAHSTVAGVGFRVVTANGAPAANAMAFPAPLAFVLGQQVTARLGLENARPGVKQDVVFTSPLVLSRAALARTGLMDPSDFPFCDSDVEWARRMAACGFELHVLEDVACVHDQGNNQSEFSRRRTLDFHRARLAYFRRYHAGAVPLLKAGLLGRHAVELAALTALWAAGRVSADRVGVRLELLRRWARDYRDGG